MFKVVSATALVAGGLSGSARACYHGGVSAILPENLMDLPRLDRRGRTWDAVHADTLLFESGRLDSLSILHLIARVEDLTGAPVPDHLVVMRHFQNVDAITAAFCKQ